ncbi:uncharacterized protein LOC143275244 [Babylonia areolata]|uniref:uncharacterized protein LOC143275244 n=1 Tax=Babylonia areolata TaxID=304850 RepID=UPI003FCF92F0
MTQVRSRDPSFSTTPILTGFGSIVGSFTDDRSIAMRLASTSTSSSTNDHPLPTYNYHHHHRRSSSFNDPPDGPQSPGPSSPSSSPPPPCTPSVPKLMAIHSVQSATGSLAEWGDSGTDRLNGAVKPLVEELQHASEMSGENSVTESHRSGTESDGSLTRVDLRDIGEDSHNFTTNTLRRCKLQVLKPYWGLLMFVGWRVFRHDVITPRSWWLRVLNVVYPVLVVLLLLYTYMYEMIACEWKLNVVKDTKVRTPKPPPTTITTPIGNYTDNETTTGTSLPKALLFNFSPTQEENLTSPTLSPSSSTPPPCDHIITTYLIPNVLHFAAYVMGMYYFRIQDNEQMYALMEKVFLQANPQHTSSSSQQKLVYKTRYVAVVFPLKRKVYCTGRHARMACVVVFLGVICLEIPSLINVRLEHIEGRMMCAVFQQDAILLWTSMQNFVDYLVPCLLLLFLNGHSLLVIKQALRARQTLSNGAPGRSGSGDPEGPQADQQADQARMTRNLLSIPVFTALTLTPYAIVTNYILLTVRFFTLEDFFEDSRFSQTMLDIEGYLRFLYFSSFASSFYLLIATSAPFRKMAREMVCRSRD